MDRQIQFYQDKLDFEIDAWDLDQAHKQGDAIVVIDARSPEAFAAARIPGAINVPHRTMSPERTAAWDRETLYVTYCDGIGCNASTKGAFNLARLGFRVKELIGGLDWWRRDGYPVETAESEPGQGDCGC